MESVEVPRGAKTPDAEQLDTALPVDPVIEVDHVTEEGVAQNGTSSPTDSTEGAATRKKKLGAFSARRLQAEAATLKQSEVLEQQQALMQETREALARLSQVSMAFSALESDLEAAGATHSVDGPLNTEEPLSILTPRKDQDNYILSAREMLADMEDEAKAKSKARADLLQDLQGWSLRALAKGKEIRGANFDDKMDGDDAEESEDENDDIPCKTCGKSNGMIIRIQEEFEAKAHALREDVKAAMEAESDQRMQRREEEMQKEMQEQVSVAVEGAISAAAKEKADLKEQISTLESALKKQGRGGLLDEGPMKKKVTELQSQLADLERSLKDAHDEKEMFKKEAEALKRKDHERTLAMQTQNANAKSGAMDLKEQVARAEEKVHQMQQEMNLQTMKSLELEQGKIEAERDLAAERKALKRVEDKCMLLEDQLLKEKERSRAASMGVRTKLEGSSDGMSRGGESNNSSSPGVKVVAGNVADIRQKDKALKDLSSKVHEMDKQCSAMKTKMEEKDIELQRQVGTMIKMDSDIERLVAAINSARETLVTDIRVSLRSVFEMAQREEATLLDTVVRENKFFQSRIGMQLLEPRVSQLEGPLMESLNVPVQLRMDTSYTFPSVPREEISERLSGFARVSGTQMIPGTPVPETRLVMSSENDDRLIHWQTAVPQDREASESNYLSTLNWDACQDRDWVTWVTPTKQSPALAMLAGAGPSRVTFNAPTEVMLSQNQQNRRFRDYLSLERLPAHPVATDMSGPPQRQRQWSPARGRPTSAPIHDRHMAFSGAELRQGPNAHRTFVATPNKGTALMERPVALEAAIEQRTAEQTLPQIPQQWPNQPGLAIEPIAGYEERDAYEAGPSGPLHPQFYRVSGLAGGNRTSTRPVSAGPTMTTGEMVADSDTRSAHPHPPPIHPNSPRSRGQIRASPLRGSHTQALVSPRHLMPPLTIPGEDSIGYKSGLMAQTSSSQYIGEQSSQEAAADYHDLGLVPSVASVELDEAAAVSSGSPPRGGVGGAAMRWPAGPRPAPPQPATITQRKHDVVSQHALQTSGGDPQVLQQRLVNAVQESREKWNQERKLRMQLESRVKELEARAGESQTSVLGERPMSASRGKGLRPQSAGGSKQAGLLAAGMAVERAGSIDGAMSVGGWSDVSNDNSMSLPRIDSSEAALYTEASKTTNG